MIQTISKNMFMDAFQKIRPDNFSYDALDLMFDYFDAPEDDTGAPIELDVIGICCEYAESSLQECVDNYSIALPIDGSDDENIECVADFLTYHSILIGVTNDNKFVYAQF